ncbi:ROK family transcriptional regulator [Ammoniphilus resinae]|uniref:Glucokinase-like ROK family protein n=1 Tax=Ammoniphilus resinae TaxID=861532 RepID=A0ABS4GM75_9BACL|nr:glucokinase-like ROK family protein [Ammoniphilus resinae]
MQVTGDQHLVKRINKSIVLETIRRRSPLSRTQISEFTGLNKGTVSSLVNELIEENLTFEIGPGKSSGGRKPVMLLFNKDAGFTIGIDLGVNYIIAILTDLQGNIVQQKKIGIQNDNYINITSSLKDLIRTLIQEAPPSHYGVVGIGIGVPGIVDAEGFILLAPNLGWENVDLKMILAEEFNIPFLIDNEANAGALGEKLFGAGKQTSNLIYISVGMGIGAGIIINNELYRGLSGFSGEVGHSIIEVNGRKCRCGNRGCWELYASENALFQLVKSLPSYPFGLKEREIDIDQLVYLANGGNHEIIHSFSQIGEYLGLGVTNIINLFNPELIILGNQFTIAENWITNPLLRTIESRALPFSKKRVTIKFSTLGIKSGALGASSLAINHFFSKMTVSVE